MKIAVITKADVLDQDLYCEGDPSCLRIPEPICNENYTAYDGTILCWRHWLKKYGHDPAKSLDH